MKYFKNLLVGFCLLLFVSFSDGIFSSWNIKVKRNEPMNLTETKSHQVDKSSNLVLFVKKNDVLTMTENAKYSGNVKADRTIEIIDPVRKKSVYSKSLKNNELNSFDIELNTIFIQTENAQMKSMELVEVVKLNNERKEHSIQTFEFNK